MRSAVSSTGCTASTPAVIGTLSDARVALPTATANTLAVSPNASDAASVSRCCALRSSVCSAKKKLACVSGWRMTTRAAAPMPRRIQPAVAGGGRRRHHAPVVPGKEQHRRQGDGRELDDGREREAGKSVRAPAVEPRGPRFGLADPRRHLPAGQVREDVADGHFLQADKPQRRRHERRARLRLEPDPVHPRHHHRQQQEGAGDRHEQRGLHQRRHPGEERAAEHGVQQPADREHGEEAEGGRERHGHA
jgi:hypothetical protein